MAAPGLNPPDSFENFSLDLSDHSATNSSAELANHTPSSISVGSAHCVWEAENRGEHVDPSHMSQV